MSGITLEAFVNFLNRPGGAMKRAGLLLCANTGSEEESALGSYFIIDVVNQIGVNSNVDVEGTFRVLKDMLDHIGEDVLNDSISNGKLILSPPSRTT